MKSKAGELKERYRSHYQEKKKPLNLPSETTELTVKPTGVIPLKRQRDKNRYTLG